MPGSRRGDSTQDESVEQAPSPEPLRLPGSLGLDPNLLVPVHSRFPGEVARLATVDLPTMGGKKTQRLIRYGDSVKQGQILAVVWSKDIGEKKSELVDALSRFDLDQRLLQRLSSLKPGTIIPEKQLAKARRNVEADVIASEKAIRTLRSWRLTEEEIDAVKQEAAELREATARAIDQAAAHDVESWRRSRSLEGEVRGLQRRHEVGRVGSPRSDRRRNRGEEHQRRHDRRSG